MEDQYVLQLCFGVTVSSCGKADTCLFPADDGDKSLEIASGT